MTNRRNSSQEEGSAARRVAAGPEGPPDFTQKLLVPIPSLHIVGNVDWIAEAHETVYRWTVTAPDRRELLALRSGCSTHAETAYDMISFALMSLRGALLELTDPEPFES